jgi:hypothetical protein
MPRWMQPVVPQLHLEGSEAAAAAPVPAAGERSPAGPARRR